MFFWQWYINWAFQEDEKIREDRSLPDSQTSTPKSLLKKAIVYWHLGLAFFFFFPKGKYSLAVTFVVSSSFDFGSYWLQDTDSIPCASYKWALFDTDEKEHQWLFSSLVVSGLRTSPAFCCRRIDSESTDTV